MIISTTTDFFMGLVSEKECISIIKKAGFDAYDFSMCERGLDEHFLTDDYLEYAKNLRKYADEIGLPCNQSHSPFPTARQGDENFNKKIMPYLIRSLEVSAILGSKICVVHPNYTTAEENVELLYKPLIPYAEKYGVKVALENMWSHADNSGKKTPAACSSRKDFNKHLDLLNDNKHFTACLDIGHAAIMNDDTTPENMIEALGDRLGALHVHDNDLFGDLHIMPYAGNINWDTVCQKFKDINYRGDFTFEVSVPNNFPVNLLQSYADYMYNVGKHLVSKLK